MAKFDVVSTVISTVNLPCDTVAEAIELLNNYETRPELLKTTSGLVTEKWTAEDVAAVGEAEDE